MIPVRIRKINQSVLDGKGESPEEISATKKILMDEAMCTVL